MHVAYAFKSILPFSLFKTMEIMENLTVNRVY